MTTCYNDNIRPVFIKETKANCFCHFVGFGNMCPEGWIRFTDSFSSEHTCILPVSDDVSTWQDAKRYCRRAEGHLLTIDSIDQYYFRGPRKAFKYMGAYLFDEGRYTIILAILYSTAFFHLF